MIDSITIIEFKMALFIVTVAEEMETIVGFGVEFLEAVRRYDCSIGFIAEVYWYKELFSSATLPWNISFPCAYDSWIILLYTGYSIWFDVGVQEDGIFIVCDRGVGANIILSSSNSDCVNVIFVVWILTDGFDDIISVVLHISSC